MSNKENSSKMKGLLKGLRYISQMFGMLPIEAYALTDDIYLHTNFVA